MLKALGIDIYGYFTGVAIAVVTCAAFASVGFYVGRETAPEPCIKNLHSMAYPWFGRIEQEMVEKPVEYNDDSGFYGTYKNSRELMTAVVEMSKDSEWPGEIYVNPRTDEHYIIPGLCYYEVDGLGEPVLYWRL